LAKLGYTTEYTAKECVTSQNSNTISVYLGNFTAIKDCDGVGFGAGEFRFKIKILNENNGRMVADYPNNSDYKSKSLNSGEKYLVNTTKSFTLPKNVGKKFTVKLICYEKDKNAFGSVKNDSRMNGLSGSETHSYDENIDSWTNSIGNRQIVLGDGGCKVSLDYSITIQ
jgi:hypothetical protein